MGNITDKELTLLPPSIQTASDLVTSPEAIRDGFLGQALAKIEKAEPYVMQAHQLSALLEGVSNVEALTAAGLPTSIEQALWSVAGFSNKALKRLRNDSDRRQVLTAVLRRIAETSPESWRQEIVFRFLLTKGDALGGTMRNYVGALAAARLSHAIIDALGRQGIEPRVLRSKNNPEKISSISWERRLLAFDRRVLGNNVDATLLDASNNSDERVLLKDPNSLLACGELKGGIDPAGADEHWKTAGKAIDRVRDRATQLTARAPHLFVVVAAIAPAMAGEIYTDLVNGQLSHAANLMKPQQLNALADWLIGL